MDDILTLAEAAEELGLTSPDGLRTQVHRGRLAARLIGKTYVVTRAELERYKTENLGRVGRRRIEDVLGWPGEPNLVAAKKRPFEDVLGEDERTNLLQTKVKPTREPGH